MYRCPFLNVMFIFCFFIWKASSFPPKMLTLLGWDWLLPPSADLMQTSQYVNPFYGETCREPSKHYKRQQGNIRLKRMFSQSKSQSTDGINARYSLGGLWGYFMLLRQAQCPTARYWMSSSVHTDFDNDETAGHRSPVATPSNIHQCWLNSRQLPIGPVSHLFPATFEHTRMEDNNEGAGCCGTWTDVHEMGTLISLSIYLLPYKSSEV